MNKSDGLQFKSFVPQLVACLEDADGMVRETAKSCVVELFRSVLFTIIVYAFFSQTYNC
jgi:CLIP-associating protein 1/2